MKSSGPLLYLRKRLFTILIVVLAASSAGAYELQVSKSGDIVRWKESCFYYTLFEDGSEDVTFSALKEAVRTSFDTWEAVSCSYFRFKETKSATCSPIGFDEEGGNMNLLVWRENDWEVDRDHAGGAMALTTLSYDDNSGRILDADIEFNGEYFDWSATGEARYSDIQNTATHEIGHMLGLEHTTLARATMAPTAEPGDVDKRTLDDDDIDGLCDLYPIDEDPEVCMKPYCGLDNACNTDACDTGSGIESTPVGDNEPRTGCAIPPYPGGKRLVIFDLIEALVLTIGQ